MSILIDRNNGQNYSENIVNPALSFNSGTWTVASGTGTTTLDVSTMFQGDSSLKIENTAPANNIIATNTIQDTTINIDGDYKLSWFVKKNIAQEVRSGAVLVYKNAALLDTQTFTIGSTDLELDINDTWLRFQSDTEYTLTKGDIITFQIRLDGVSTSELTTFINVDAFMLNMAGRNNTIAPQYVEPNGIVKRLDDLPDLPTVDGNYQLSVSSGVYTWVSV